MVRLVLSLFKKKRVWFYFVVAECGGMRFTVGVTSDHEITSYEHIKALEKDIFSYTKKKWPDEIAFEEKDFVIITFYKLLRKEIVSYQR